jgi:hypothetical protein
MYMFVYLRVCVRLRPVSLFLPSAHTCVCLLMCLCVRVCACRSTLSVAAVDDALTAAVMTRVAEATGRSFMGHALAKPELWDAVFPLSYFLDVYEAEAPPPAFDLATAARYEHVPLRAPTLVVDTVRP